MKIHNYRKGATVVVQNSPNKGFFYVVKSGILEIDSEHKLGDKELSRFEPGDSFGLVSALTGYPFLVSVFAGSDCQVIEVPIQTLGSYLKSQKELAVRMIGLYTRELRAIHKHLSKVNTPADRNYHPEKLLYQAGTYVELGYPRYAAYALHTYIKWAREKGGQEAGIRDAEDQLSKLEPEKDYKGPEWKSAAANLEAEEVLFLENEPSKEIYVIQSGAVKLFSLARGRELIIDILGPGELFGEMAFVDDQLRMASTVTVAPTQVLRFSKQNLFDSVGEAILQKIFESLARRIWFSHQRLVILRLKDPIARLYAFLYNLIRDDEIKGQRPKNSNDPYVFHLNLDDLKKMCGIGRIDDEKIKPLLDDRNIEFEDHQVTVHNRKRVEDRVAFFRTRVGQISSSLA